jgi:DNA-binding HxlR family transcriptional regulator
MRSKILEVLSTETLDYIELYKKVSTPEMYKNKYMRSQLYPQLLKEMVEEGLIKEDGFIERFVMPKKRILVLYTLTPKGKTFLNNR